MSWRTAALLLSLALPATGCWMESCTYGSPSYQASCEEQLTGLFALGDEQALDWCTGDVHPFESCGALGYTEECGGRYFEPHSPALLECRSYP